ncbi:MAG: aerotolerance regulator BatA, partial [Calditrichaeota bacterium]|nr:aerotolerance regulator BatA [Calditrichota bacterium]
MFRFANPEFLALFAVIPVLIFWYIKRNKQASATLRYSNL